MLAEIDRRARRLVEREGLVRQVSPPGCQYVELFALDHYFCVRLDGSLYINNLPPTGVLTVFSSSAPGVALHANYPEKAELLTTKLRKHMVLDDLAAISDTADTP